MHEVGDALVRAGLMEPVLDVERVQVGYPDVLSLMRDLKAIGAHNVTAGRPRALVGRSRLKRMQDAYEALRRDDRLPATYEVIYGASWGAAGRRAAAATAGEARIPPRPIPRAGPPGRGGGVFFPAPAPPRGKPPWGGGPPARPPAPRP